MQDLRTCAFSWYLFRLQRISDVPVSLLSHDYAQLPPTTHTPKKRIIPVTVSLIGMLFKSSASNTGAWCSLTSGKLLLQYTFRTEHCYDSLSAMTQSWRITIHYWVVIMIWRTHGVNHRGNILASSKETSGRELTITFVTFPLHKNFNILSQAVDSRQCNENSDI